MGGAAQQLGVAQSALRSRSRQHASALSTEEHGIASGTNRDRLYLIRAHPPARKARTGGCCSYMSVYTMPVPVRSRSCAKHDRSENAPAAYFSHSGKQMQQEEHPQSRPAEKRGIFSKISAGSLLPAAMFQPLRPSRSTSPGRCRSPLWLKMYHWYIFFTRRALHRGG